MSFLLMLRRLRSLCIKELLIILKDPANRIVLIAPIIVQSIIFGYAATFDLSNVPFVVCDQDRTAISRSFISHIDSSKTFSRIATLNSSAEAERQIYDGAALFALQIPSDFSRRLKTGNNASIQVILDGRNSTTASFAVGYLTQIMADWNEAKTHKSMIKIKSRAWFNPQLETRWNIMPGMVASLSLMEILVLAALSVSREREQGTFDQMLVTPLSPWEILVGKSIPPIIIGLVQATIILWVCLFWFNIPFSGSYLDLYIVLLIFTLSSVGIGLWISAVSLTMQQSLVYCFVVLFPMILLSGLATPIHAMPKLFQYATYANPLRFALVGVRRIYLEGATLSDISSNFIPMLIVAVITLPIAAWLFRNKLQ